ncbi:lipoyl(octanoyl) transferase LipB [Compostibacter hankyongensis]|uniref:Octanoyltransferase n=1 Tax=Compostibacter hankyongensis TaxID=1007089 RepID=A0ABP8GAV1_9BACT
MEAQEVARQVFFRDLGRIGYGEAWDYQESLLQENVKVKTAAYRQQVAAAGQDAPESVLPGVRSTVNYLLFCEHPPVYTLGKSGKKEHLLLDPLQLEDKGITFFHTNRGGDITFHGPGQLVGYPILDLEKFFTDIGRYLRSLEEVIIRTIAAYGVKGERSPGETGVWIEPGHPLRARKICAMGVRCSRWITMHGFALNINTDLTYFGGIVPCGIADKQVTSLEKECGRALPAAAVKAELKKQFETVFGATLTAADTPVTTGPE